MLTDSGATQGYVTEPEVWIDYAGASKQNPQGHPS